MDVFVLWHVNELPDGEEDAKLLGVYSLQESADNAKKRMLSQPGFRDFPHGFVIERYQVDQDHWTEGFVTVTHEDLLRRERKKMA
jgi:hypothetical protein